MKAVLIAAMLVTSAATPLADPLARFSYSAGLAQQMNAAYGSAPAPRFVIDDVRGRERGDPHLLGAIQALIRTFPACGNRQLQFAYAFGEDATTSFIAFSQAAPRVPKCPGRAVVALSNVSIAVTVRSFPDV